MESPTPQDDLAMAQAAAWAVRLGGTPTGEDGVEFDAWLDAAPGNRAAYRQAVLLLQEFDARAGDVLAALAQPTRPHAVRAEQARPSDRRGAGRAAERPTRRRSGVRWLAPAAGAALAAGLALAVMPTLTTSTAPIAYATGKGQHRHVQLADGSTIDLDAETKLSVAMSGRERRVILGDGQAIFDVVHDPRRPFVVQAGERLVRDVGTQFDVRRQPDQLTVTVARGKVEVDASANAGHGVLLGPGQRLTLDAAGVGRLSAVDPAETFSWRAGRLVYRAQPLSEVVADLNRQFVEQTTIADPELANLPITGVIVLDSPRAVVERLSLMLPVKAVPSEKGLMLLRK